jgi:glycosyltransferase involved in cell wall biosynthesis
MVSVVAPVYGNAATVEELCRRLSAAIAEEHEIVLVDDGCPRGSWAAIEAVAAAHPVVRGIRHDVNRGQNAAVLTGVAAARGEEIVVLDADLQDPPEAVPLLLAELRGSEAAAVFGGRRGRYESPLRLLGSRVFKRTLWLLSERALPRDAGLFLVMDRRMRGRLPLGACGDPYVLAVMGRSGLPMRSVPVTRGPARGSAYRGRDRLRLGLRAIRQGASR